MSTRFPITQVSQSRLSDVDFDNLGFGSTFADHMFAMTWRDGEWSDAGIIPFADFAISPAALGLHYGQSIFEGLKAYRGTDNAIRLFRPDMNYKRLMNSCGRLLMPTFDQELFVDALTQLTQTDVDWVPRKRGQSYYLRPLMVATEPSLLVRAASEYRFMIMASPSREFFDENIPAVSLKVEQHYTRAAPGGMGYAKTAGNYAAALAPGQASLDEGHDQVLWLDGREHRYVEEVGQMNIFFRFKDRVVTPELRGTILPGVTRDSVLQLLRDRDIACEERVVDIEEITSGIRSGELIEAFGTGTAAVVAPVGRLTHNDEHFDIGGRKAGELALSLYDELLGIQHGSVADRHGWTLPVSVPASAAVSA